MDGLVSPYTGLWLIAIYSGDWTSPRDATWSCCDGACWKEEASWGIIIDWWLYPLLVPVHKISQGKWILTRRCLPPGKVMMLLGLLPK
jgi:heme A synthase